MLYVRHPNLDSYYQLLLYRTSSSLKFTLDLAPPANAPM